jgi:hypothetical protein
LFLVSIVSIAAFAQDAREPIGHMTAAFGTVSWRPTVAADSYHLTIGLPDGTRVEKDVTDGKSLSIRADELGDRPDGVYTYDLRANPRISSQLRAALDNAREKGDQATIERLSRENGFNNPVVQSGTFGVMNGAILASDGNEGTKRLTKAATATTPGTLKPAPLDQVIADDLIVQGSACIGLDCVNNESFGFDTIRLKENNTRIKFEDTSTSTGFPTHDWQLTANDSASGGAEKFSIEDITAATVPFTVTGSSPTNSLFVASNGKVGFGNSSPGLNLHITATDTPAIRQEQTNGGGFTAQTWDIGANEANWFVRDVTGGSRLPLRIRPGAPTSSLDISASGGIGFGTASPLANYRADFLQTTSQNGVRFFLDFDSTHKPGMEFGTIVTGGPNRVLSFDRGQNAYVNFFIEHGTGAVGTTFASNGNVGFNVTNPTFPIQHSSGAKLTSGGVWTDASSRDFKTDICDLETTEAKAALNELNPVHFTYKADLGERHVGFIAEDVPDMVAAKDRKGLSPMDIVAVLTKVVQDQQKTIDELKTRIDSIEKSKN